MLAFYHQCMLFCLSSRIVEHPLSVVMIAACTCFLAFSVLCLCCVSFVLLCHVAMPEVASASAQASGLLQVRALEDDANTHKILLSGVVICYCIRCWTSIQLMCGV